MFSLKRPLRWSVLLFIIFAGILLTGCGTRGTNSNWPGLSTDGQTVYAAYGKRVAAYNVAEQKLEWQFPITASTAPIYTAPSVEDGRVIFGDYGASGGMLNPKSITTIYAVENGTGSPPATMWENKTATSGKVIPPPLQVGDTVFIGTNSNFIIALDSITGRKLWEVEVEEPIWGQPVHRGEVIYITSVDGNIFALDIDNGDKLWQKKVDFAIAGGIAMNDELFYIADFSGSVHAFLLSSGAEEWVIQADAATWATPVYADGTVYFTDINGNIYAVDAQNGERLWQQSIEYPLQSSPLIHDGVVYIASGPESDEGEGKLIAYDADSGKTMWQQSTTAPLHTTPVIADNAVVVISQAGTSYSILAFNIETGTQKWQFLLPE